jgi:uncharacterized ion transporter superfamily protein YfcC
VVVPGTYHALPGQGVGWWWLFTGPLQGFVSAAHIIAFVLFVGGAFGVLSATGALDAALQSLVSGAVAGKQARVGLLVVLTIFFSLAGCTFGMSEEVLVFVLITLPLTSRLGYDRFTGVFVPFVGAGVGFAGAAFNPFTVGIAHGISELTPFSGWEFRMIVWLGFTAAAVLFLLWSIQRTGAMDGGLEPLDFQESPETAVFTFRHRAILALFGLSLVLLVVGVNRWEWYIEEIGALFLALGLTSGLLAGFSPSVLTRHLIAGASDMMTPALVIGMSKAILLVAEEGQIIDTMLHGTSQLVAHLHPIWAAEAMLVFQSGINFFVPSGSGQAALTMPIMAPLSDLIGIHRQTAVLAFQFGDGLVNLIIPTSGVTMGVLALAKIPFGRWLRFIMPLMLILFALAMAFLAMAVMWPVWG